MIGNAPPSAELDYRRRKARFRAWHRGMREADLLLGAFADRELPAMDEDDLERFEALMGENDAELVKWITGEAPVPPRHDTPLFARMRSLSTKRES